MRTEDRVNYFSDSDHLAGRVPVLADGSPPRGLTDGGWVRTTGWLQVGDQPVSSAHVAAMAGLLWALAGAAALVRTFPVVAGMLVLTAPVLSGAAWWLLTTRLRPASPARNIGTKQAEELSPGDVVRQFGSIGPVGRVAEVTFGDDIRVVFHGGSHRSWGRGQAVHVAELLG